LLRNQQRKSVVRRCCCVCFLLRCSFVICLDSTLKSRILQIAGSKGNVLSHTSSHFRVYSMSGRRRTHGLANREKESHGCTLYTHTQLQRRSISFLDHYGARRYNDKGRGHSMDDDYAVSSCLSYCFSNVFLLCFSLAQCIFCLSTPASCRCWEDDQRHRRHQPCRNRRQSRRRERPVG
jgi:hypothetical protein